MQRRHLLAAGALAALGRPAFAQKSLFDGPVTVVLPLQAASASDVALRAMTERLGPRVGTALVVENIAAAAGLVGLDRLNRAKPDGRTLAAFNNSILTILPHLQASKIKGEPRRDYLPVAGFANIPTFFAVPAASPVRDIRQLVQRAKTQRVTYSSGGVGSPQHLAAEMFKAYTGAPIEHIPYRGASQAALAVASGEVDVMPMALSLAQPFLPDKRVRLVGFCGRERHGQFREVPTLQEQGVKDYEYASWIGLFLHKDAPPELLQALRREALAVAADRDFQVQLIRSGLEAWVRSPEQLTKVVDEDFQRWKTIIQHANIPNA
jgi:tripartite-type tricarboxylate transporter receptor subunit TctC